MNWLQKLCQDDDMSQAEQYFSIGHGDFDEESGDAPNYIVWALINGSIRTGPLSGGEGNYDDIDNPLSSSTHGTLWGHDVTDRAYKGRYEPDTGRLSIVKPSNRTMYDIPQSLYDLLNEKFGFVGRITVF